MTEQDSRTPPKKSRFGWRHVLGIAFIAIIVVALLSAWWVKQNIYASQFEPTSLSAKEQEVLDSKLARLEKSGVKEKSSAKKAKSYHQNMPLEPEPYSEDDAKREISLSEKELNALIAKDPETAKRVAIDLADDLVSVKLLVPMDKDFPILGGKTLRLFFGVTLSYKENRPIVAIRGISLGGVPLPSAWWGDIKNKNLVEEFGSEGGFWDQFSKGVQDIKIREGHLRIKLKE
jgi:hypothetical protein